MQHKYLRSVLHPEIFHGFGKRGPFFEGWYYKLVNPDGRHRWSIIPGIYLGDKPENSHCFIQLIDGVTGNTFYINFPFGQFIASEDTFQVSIGKNRFSAREIHLEIDSEELAVYGDLHFASLSKWPVTLFSPGIMGWFAWLPGMECYHGIVSLDHNISGCLQINSRKNDFSGGRGYIEKDWGRAMPKAWIWLQCNHFQQPGVSLTLSIAVVPLGSLTFNGFIVGILLKGDLYKFATYTGARMGKIIVNENQVGVSFADKSKKLLIHAKRVGGGSLQAPTLTQMDRRITETLSAEVDVELSIRQNGKWKKIFEDSGSFAGLEVVGNLNS